MADFPAMSGTWYSQVNVPCHASASTADTAKSFWFNLKTLLCGQNTSGTLSTSTGTRPTSSYWEVVSSSNGVSHGTTDYWGTVYTGSNFVSASSGASHSWIILKNTTNGYHLLLDMNSTTATTGRISLAKGVIAGGALTSPATTTETFIIGAASDTTSAGAAYFGDLTIGAGQHYMHFTINANGEFIFFISRAGQNIFHSISAFLKLSDSDPADTRNYATFYDSTTSGRGAGRAGTMAGSLAYSMRRLQNGSLITAGGVIAALAGGTHFTTAGIDGVRNKYNTWKIPHASTSPMVQYGGFFPDVYWCGTATNCASIPSTSAQQWVLSDSMLIPAIDVVPIT